MNKKWSEKTILEKTAYIISYVALGVWLVFEVLERTEVLKDAQMITCIAVCVVCICQAFSFWNVKRNLSYIAIAGAVLLLAVVLLMLM